MISAWNFKNEKRILAPVPAADHPHEEPFYIFLQESRFYPVFMAGKGWHFLFQRCIMNMYVLSGDSIMYGIINTKIPKNISAAGFFSVSFLWEKGYPACPTRTKPVTRKSEKSLPIPSDGGWDMASLCNRYPAGCFFMKGGAVQTKQLPWSEHADRNKNRGEALASSKRQNRW